MSKKITILLFAVFLALSVLGILGFWGFLFGGAQFDNEVELEKKVVDFLKTTDVPHGVWNESVKIREIYDRKLGGRVLVVDFVTMNMGHPEFMLEAIEGHTAILTLNSEGWVISAFCIHGSHIWDLFNQKWVSIAIISEQQAIATGKIFLDSIGCTTRQVLSIEFEERLPNFYWHDLAGLEKPDIDKPRLCWIIKFEQAKRPGHYFEVWLDAYIGEVLGGEQCR